jgi:acetoin utilization protein AcuB
MLVRDRMSRRVITIDADRPLREASRLLARHRIRQLPVLRRGQLVGIITHRDLRGARPPTGRVASLMTAKPFTIAPDAAVDEAARLLRTYKIGGLPVVERKQLVGIITVSDALDALVALSGVSEPTYRLVASGGRGRATEARARRAVERAGGELKWLHRDARSRPPELQMRVKVKRVDDVVGALEADGFEVLRVVAAPRAA